MKKYTTLLFILVFFLLKTNIGNAQCAPFHTGFTNIGQMNGHNYYLSNHKLSPEDAQAYAVSLGGYLVVINNAEEDDYLLRFIDELVYIGLTDVNTEASFEWLNGEAVGYTNINPCDFCQSNDDNQDYVVKEPWNEGSWSFSNVYAQRKYIMEIPCGASSTNCSFRTEQLQEPFSFSVEGVNKVIKTPTGFEIRSTGAGSGLIGLKKWLIDDELGMTVSLSKVEIPFDLSQFDRGRFSCIGDYFFKHDVVGQNPRLFKVDFAGNTVWEKSYNVNTTIPNVTYTISRHAWEDADGILITGHSGNGPNGERQAFLIKTDLDGNEQWQQFLPNENSFLSLDVNSRARDGGYYLTLAVGSAYTNKIIKVDSLGNMLWSHTVLSTSPPFRQRSFIGEGGNGTGFFYTESQGSFSSEFIAVKLNAATGNVEWEKNVGDLFGQLGVVFQEGGAILTSDGGLILKYKWLTPPDFNGNTGEKYGKIDTNGDLVWGYDLPLDMFDARLLTTTNDDGFVFASNHNFGTNPHLIWKFTSNGWNAPICENTNSGNIQVNCTLNLPSNLIVDPSDPTGKTVTWDAPTATSSCSGGVTIEKVSGPDSGSFLNAWQTYTIVYAISDQCGNQENCVVEIKVDGIPGGLNCPANIVVNASSPDGAIVNYDLPVVSPTSCIPEVPHLTSGLSSGSLFPIGTTLVEYSSFFGGSTTYCQNPEVCSFTVTVNDTLTGGGCPNDFAGFTTLGEFAGSKYYISNDAAQPIPAQVAAEANGGYLATISSQAENDFIQQNINSLVYLGLNDFDTEGNLQWSNGEAFTFDNINPCGFCNANSDDQDFVIMQPWDGAWSFSNVWNQRKYIMEISCSGGNDLPDLTVSNIANLPNSGSAGDVISFNFDLSNNGTAVAIGNYKVNSYISTDTIFSADDILVGEVPTGGTPIGTITNVPAAITVPTLVDGNYFLIVVADANEEITESKEDNNTIAVAFTIETGTIGGSCAYFQTYPSNVMGTSKSFSYHENANGLELEIITWSGFAPSSYDFETVSITQEGIATATTNLALPTIEKSKFGNFSYGVIGENTNFTQLQVSAFQPDGTTTWSNAINLTSSDTDIDAWSNLGVKEMGDHIIVYGVYHYGLAAKWRPFLIKLSLDGVKIWQKLQPTVSYLPFFEVAEEAIGGGYMLSNIDYSGSSLYHLAKTDATGNQEWTNTVAGDLVSNRIIYGGQSPDGTAVFMGIWGPGNNTADITKIDMNTGVDFWQKHLVVEFFPASGGVSPDFGQYIRGMVPTVDGGVVANGVFYDLSVNPVQEYNRYGRLDTNGDLVWVYDMPSNATSLGANFMTSDGGFIFAEHVNDSINVFKVNSDGLFDPMCNGGGGTTCPSSLAGFTSLGEFEGSAYFLSESMSRPTDAQVIASDYGGYLAVIGSQAENDFIANQISDMVYLGLDDYETEGTLAWVDGSAVTYTNFDVCDFCSGNSADIDFVVMHNWNGGWSWSNFWSQRKYIVEIPCASSSTNLIQNLTSRSLELAETEHVVLEKIYPNPAMDEIFISLNNPIEQVIEIQVFDARGILVKTEKMNLTVGKNTAYLSIAKLPAGFYSIFIPQIKTHKSSLRFVKLRD